MRRKCLEAMEESGSVNEWRGRKKQEKKLGEVSSGPCTAQVTLSSHEKAR